jgi:chemotaxis-related protein WspB
MLLLTFTAGPNRYGVAAGRVVEVVPKVKLRSVPHAPSSLAGLLAYRGKVIPVVDLCRLLDGAVCQERLSTRILVVNDAADDRIGLNQARSDSQDITASSRSDRQSEPTLLGLVAERVTDLHHVRPEQVIPAPMYLSPAPYLDVIIQTDQGIVQLLAVDKIRNASLQPSALDQDATSDLKSAPAHLTKMSLDEMEL